VTFFETFRIGLRALHANKMRSMLTMLGIVVGVAAVVCMVSVGSGARQEVSEKLRTLGANLLVIRPGTQVSGGARLESGTGHTLTQEDASTAHAAVQNRPDILKRRWDSKETRHERPCDDSYFHFRSWIHGIGMRRRGRAQDSGCL
jgi:ABC-type lipoprotein release transport system permease subunit